MIQAPSSCLNKIKMFEDMGVHRVVLARELSLEEIKEVIDRGC